MPAPTLRDILPPSPEQLQQQLIGDNQLYRGFATGIKSVTSGSLANDALNAESNGAPNATTLRDRALASQQAAAAYAPRVGSLRNIHSIGDAVDYGLGAVGQGVASMAPTIAAAALTRVPGSGAALSRATSYAGAAGAGYLQEKGEAALGQYSDPTLAAAPVTERQRAATTKGLVNAALEGIVPAGLTSMVGKNGVGRIMAKDFVTEGATEATQQYVGHLADKSLDATRQLDPWDIADAFAGGALTGGAVGAVHGAVHKLATGPKDFVTSTRAAIEDAGANAPTPTDFLKSVFKPGPSVELDPVAAGDNHPDLVDAVTKAGDSAGEVLDGLTAKRGEMAASYAQEILNDPNTPAAVKQTIMDMGGDYESPQNQAALGAQYVGRKASEVAGTAADFIKGMAPKAAEAAKGFVTSVQDRVVKKNLQGGPVTEDETFALHKDIIDNLKPEAKRRTSIISDMPQLAAGIAGALNKYGAVKTAPTDKNIQELQHLYSAATTLFDKPEAVFAKLASKVEAQREGAKKPTPFSDLLAGVTTAQQDVGKNEGSSYLQTRLIAPMGQAEVKQLARFVDEFGMTDMKSTKQADKVLDGLAVAFGGKQEALQVLDYYSKANRLNAKQLLQYDANELLDPESGVQATDLKPTRTYSFADPKTNRPFRSAERLAKLDAQSLREGAVASDSAKVTTVPYSQYVDETGKDHKAEVVRIMNDVKGRQDKAYAGYAAELGIKGTPEAKLAAARNAALERRKSPDPKSTRLADIDRLQGELDMARSAYKEGGPKAVLDLYEVNAAEQNEKDDLTATDEDIKAMATNKNDEDMVSFTKADGTKMVLSSKSMARTQAAKEKATGRAARGEGGTTREARLLKEAIASVLAREDIVGVASETKAAPKGPAERAGKAAPGANTRTELKDAPPTLKTFPRSKDTKAALKEQEPSVAELKKRTDEAAREYEDNDDPESRDKIRTGIERNIARLQSQYEAAEGAAPLRAVIRQRQAVYKEALAAINDVDFQERVDQREKDGPDTAAERTEPTGVRTFEEDVGTFVGDEKRGSENARYAEKYGPALAAPDTPKSKERVEREKKVAEERDKTAFAKLKEGVPIGEDRIFKKSLQGTGAPSDKLIDAVRDVVVNENYARLDTPEKVLAFTRAAKQVLSHLQGLGFDQYEAMGADRADGLMRLRDQLEQNFDQSGTSAFDWHSLFDNEGTKADLAEMDRIVGGSPAEQPKVALPQKSSYAAKDQAKWDKANKFIGRGSKYSSTNAYAQAIGPTRANTGKYEVNDVVFVSAEGARTGRISPDFAEIKRATDAGATIIADNVYNRERSYNVGEREVAAFLARQGYQEKFGVWTKPTHSEDRITKNSFVGAKYFPESHKSAEAFFAGEPTQEAIFKVFQDHGWFKGPDGKLRREVAPGPIISAFNKALDAWNKDVIGDIFTGEALLSLPKLLADAGGKWAEAYGEVMKGYTVSVSDFDSRGREIYSEGLGSFDSRSKIINVSPTAIAFNLLYKKDGALVDKLIESGLSGRALAKRAMVEGLVTETEIKAAITSTFMHEFQHAIQKAEGFDGGSNPQAAVLNAYATEGEKLRYKAASKQVEDALLNGAPYPEAAMSVLDAIQNRAMQRLMEKLGPDGDYEAEAHRLYLRNVGETEAREVQHRIKLLGPDNMEGRRALKPGLSYTASFSLFSTNFLNDVAASIVRNNKQDARTESGSTTPKDQQDALDEILRIRGKDVRVAFGTLLGIGGSGEFSMNKDKTKRLIRLAIDGANMKSTAWHESLHDFIAMLGSTPEGRAIKRDMLAATNTPYINAKLRELLKDHPAALKQLSDPEERLAYVYQFWAEGALKLTPKADSLLGRIAEFIQNLLGIVSQDGKLDAQLAALHRGELVEPSTVARVLDNLDAKTVRDKLEGLSGPLGEGLSKVFTSATDRLRKPGVDSLDKLAGLFHKDPGHESGEGGMLQRRAQKEGQFSNAYQKLVEGTTAAERLNALNNLQAMKTPQGPLELGLTKLLDDMYGYMTEAGVATFNKETKKWDPVRRVANYFPRSWDGESIRKDAAGFKALLTANGVSMQQADATIDMLTKSGNDQFDLVENDKALGFVPLAVHVNDRVFTFITKNNAALFAKYQNKDVTDIMTTYIRQASHRGEYARSFGNNGEVIEELLKKAREEGMTHAEEASILPTIRGLEGTLGHDMNPEMKKIMSGVITVENVLLMPMAIFSQMVDPIGIAMRTNSVKDAGAAYLQSLKDLRKAITRDKSYDYDRELTKMLGIISTDSMLETMGQTQGSMYMTSTMRHINQKFFRYNGMEGWNNSMRVAATVAGERYLLANVSNERAMTELNVDPKNVRTMPTGTKDTDAGRMAITKDQFLSLGMKPDEAQTAAEQIQEAMFRFVDGAVVRPNAAHRATWMSDPRFQLLSHLKQFTFSFQSAVLNRARNEYIHGNSTPMLLLSMTVPITLAADIAKWAMTGTMPANWTAFDYMAHAVVRSGILGKYEYAARSLEDAARGNVPGLSFAGPTVEHANILAQWIAGAPGASSDRVIDRSIPLARYA